MNDSSLQQSPRELGYRWPAEWEPHRATWLSWPHNPRTWPDKFEPVPAVFAEFARTIARFEPVHILATGNALLQAKVLVGREANITLHDVPTNDCWIRDHGPWFLQHSSAPPLLIDWEYNAWGGKYPPFAADNAVPGRIAQFEGYERRQPQIIMEGGSVENNGAGTLLVTSQCLLNPNRNPDLNREQISEILCQNAGAEQVLWLFEPDDESLAGDDTDAHIDQLARFVDSSTIFAVTCSNPEDPNFSLLESMHRQLVNLRDPQGNRFEILPVELPDPVYHEEERLPASYANFYVGNGFVIMPTFRSVQDQVALGILKDCYPEREVIGIDATDLVWGLGAFHCASMQQGVPAPL